MGYLKIMQPKTENQNFEVEVEISNLLYFTKQGAAKDRENIFILWKSSKSNRFWQFPQTRRTKTTNGEKLKYKKKKKEHIIKKEIFSIHRKTLKLYKRQKVPWSSTEQEMHASHYSGICQWRSANIQCKSIIVQMMCDCNSRPTRREGETYTCIWALERSFASNAFCWFLSCSSRVLSNVS